MKLIIVESPTKSKTLARFLGDDFLITSCNGHVRDLPRGEMGIDIEKDFEPRYVIPRKKQKTVSGLKKISAEPEIIYLATDEDREGEAIAWHLSQILKPKNGKQKNKFRRIAFHEITEEAVKSALKNPREIDLNLVEAQKARRILDRLVGYKLSPFLWKKVAKRLSAGRVQSPAVRLIAEREKEIEAFKPTQYWSVEAELLSNSKESFAAKLIKKDNRAIHKLDIKSKEEADEIVKDLKEAKYRVSKIQEKEIKKSPPAPFTTSSLVQEANKKLGFSARRTMRTAQELYEGASLGQKGNFGLITYMRTDSLNLAQKFLIEAADFIKKEYGKNYSEVHEYKTKTKVAQEAHEAIRPTSISESPEKIKEYLDKNQYKLYDLIWRRALASQMPAAALCNTSADIEAEQYLFRANGTLCKFDGWLKTYPDKQIENYLPALKVNEILILAKLNAKEHFTEPPARYTDASLVKALEELGIGRPSTYAPIIYTIQARNYVQKERNHFKPTEIGVLVNELLVNHFAEIVDYQFTAQMENDLDEIANGEKDYLMMIKNFYGPFKNNLEKKEKEIAKSFVEEKTDETCPQCGKALVIKMGRFGKFLACSGFPECKYTKSLAEPEKIGMKCPKCGQGEIIKKRTKKGRFFYGCDRWPKCDFASWQKPG